MEAPPCWSRALFSRERRLRRSSAHILLVFSDEDGFTGTAPAFQRTPPASIHP